MNDYFLEVNTGLEKTNMYKKHFEVLLREQEVEV
jgi:hypothetical protein